MLLNVVSSVIAHVSYSRGKSSLNFSFCDTMESVIGVRRLLNTLATSALRSRSEEQMSPNTNTISMEPPKSSHPCHFFNCFAIFLDF